MAPPITHSNESGQILLFFALVLFTLMSFAALVIVTGQILARKALAQKLADIGALAGASQQASSLNYITDVNSKSFKLLRATAFLTRAGPFDLWRDADSLVDPALTAMDPIFLGLYGAAMGELTSAPGKAKTLAEDVTRQNIGYLFPLENVSNFHYEDPEYHLNPTTNSMLFVPTAPYTRTVYWGYYTDCIPCPIPGCTCDPFTWIDQCVQYYSYLGGSVSSHDFTTYFTRQTPSQEIHFYWEVKIPATPSMLGIFGQLPEITATAKAKPYGGYSGDAPEDDDIPPAAYTALPDCTCPFGQINNTWTDFKTYKVEHDFRAVYKAKLDPLTNPQDASYIVDLKNRFGQQGEVKH